MSRIAIVGTGYVGLTTAACLAELGHEVTGFDVDPIKVEKLRRGVIPIFEEGLAPLVQDNQAAGRLRFTADPGDSLDGAEFVFLCVQTPQDSDGSADLSFVLAAASGIGPRLDAGAVVITKSTVPVGTSSLVRRALGRPDVDVVSNPEFLREGRAVWDCLHPQRIVIGSDRAEAARRVAALYISLDAPVLTTSLVTAEAVKYASNAFLATKLSYVNCLESFCRAVGADVYGVLEGMGYDRRIGSDFLKPGPGWGGSCFPKDTSALIRVADDHGYDFRLLKEVIAANDRRFDEIADRILGCAGGDLRGVAVAVWGLTFKAGTDDMRDSPAIAVVRRLQKLGADVRAYDPMVSPLDDLPRSVEGIEVCVSAYEACRGAAVLAVLTEWDDFIRLDLDKVREMLVAPIVVDTRGVLDGPEMERRGFIYDGPAGSVRPGPDASTSCINASLEGL